MGLRWRDLYLESSKHPRAFSSKRSLRKRHLLAQHKQASFTYSTGTPSLFSTKQLSYANRILDTPNRRPERGLVDYIFKLARTTVATTCRRKTKKPRRWRRTCDTS